VQRYGVLIDYLSVSIKSVFEALRIDCRGLKIKHPGCLSGLTTSAD
jgi:hypothetical protein